MSDFDLKGKRIADTYKGLLKLAVSGNGVVSSSLTQVEGGDGTNTALFVATDSVKVGGAFAVSSSVSVGGSLQVTGDVCASSYYGSGRHLTSVVATGDTSVSTLIVANTAEIGGALSVGGGVTLTGAVNLLSTATVSGAAGFLGTVRVSGNTSLGGTLDVAGTATFTNVDVDDINLNGKVFTVTGDTGDTFKITAGANGATTLETVDTAGNAANLTIDADGIIRLDSGSTYGNIQLAHVRNYLW
jgi:fibronectin-binding autotransporter adhesin